MRGIAWRMTAILMVWVACTDCAPKFAQTVSPDKNKEAIVKQVVSAFKEYHHWFNMFWNPPPGVKEPEAFFRMQRARVYLESSLRGTIPEAIAEILLIDRWLALETVLHPQSGSLEFRTSFLELLDKPDTDKRVKDIVLELRKKFEPSPLGLDHQWLSNYLKKHGKIPTWYLDRMFGKVSSVPVWFIYPSYRRGEAMHPHEALYFLAAHDEEFIRRFDERKKEQISDDAPEPALIEILRTIRIIQNYQWLVRAHRAERQDLELAKKQLKWLWETKKWWARRYVVEVVNFYPQLAFENALHEIMNEQHPLVAPRVEELRLVERLQRQPTHAPNK